MSKLVVGVVMPCVLQLKISLLKVSKLHFNLNVNIYVVGRFGSRELNDRIRAMK